MSTNENKIYKKFSQYYDAMMKDNHIYDEYVQFIEKNFDKNYSILDAACGTGELIARLITRKFRNVEGFDNSKKMAEIARKKTKRSIFIKNLAEFSTKKKYDLVICSFDSLNYLLTEKDLYGFFKSSNNCLSKNGHLIFDMNTKKKFIQNSGVVNFKTEEGLITIDSKYDGEYWVLRIKNNCGNNKFEEVHKEKAYPIKLVSKLLNKAGFISIKNNYSGFVKNDNKKLRCFFIAIK